MTTKDHKKFTVRKTFSNSLSQAPTVPDIAQTLDFGSKKFLFDSKSDFNLSKICRTNRKISELDGAQTSRTVVNHIELAQNINKRFTRTNAEDNPFLRAKLKHIVKKWPTKQDQVISPNQIKPIEPWMQQPKFVTLRRVIRDNNKKQIEIKKLSENTIKNY